MARFTDELISRVKQEVSVLRLVEASGVELKPHGKDRIGRCPFHDDKTPSLVVSPESNLWNCLGACQTGGDTIQWVMKVQGISFRHAVDMLSKDMMLSEPLSALVADPVKKHTAATLDVLLSEDAEAQQLLNQVTDFYHDTLKQSPEVLEYLASRGLNDPELIQHFKLGYANRTLAYRLPEKSRKAGADIRGKLQEVGILRESGHEHLNGSVVVPVFDGKGNVCELYGRKILGSRLRKGTAQHLYLPGPHKGVWNESGLQGCAEVILCEALIDAMTFWVHGYKNVTASYGTSGFTADHFAAFKACGAERILIAYDRDEAGNNAAEKLAKQLQKEGFTCYRLHFPKGMDANQYAQEVMPAAKSLGVVIRSAEFIGKGEPPARSGASMHSRDTVHPEHKRQLDITIPLAKSMEQKTVENSPSLAAEKSEDKNEIVLPASVVPPSPENVVAPEVSEHEINIAYGNRKYRVRGLQKNTSYEVLKVNVLVAVNEGGSMDTDTGAIHVDTFDMYSAKHRLAFARVAAAEAGVDDKAVLRDLGQLLLQLESLQDQAIQEALKPKDPTAYTMQDDEREQALELLRDPELSSRIIHDFAQTGLVGEPTNALMGYFAAVSRKLKNPLAIIVQSTSAAGKSALMDAVLKLVPEEDRVHYSAMTGQSLFYLGETNLKHKILGIAEEEGVRQAAYALKLLQSQGELTIASTGKDPQSGKLVTEEYRVEGPVMLFLTTTAIDIDEELLNRCVVLTINESREQTAAIQQRQRQARTLTGLLASHGSDQLIKQHQNAQRLLKPLAVVNPYAEHLRFADSRTRTRRDHEKYLTLIDTIALLHQYQREVKTISHNGENDVQGSTSVAGAGGARATIEYIEVTLNDIALANQLAHDILGRSLDELPPPTRCLLECLYALVARKIKTENLRQNEVRFTRREVREAAGLSDTQVRTHLDRLVALEYVLAHAGKNGQRFVYELVFDGEFTKDKPQLMGLIDVEQLKNRARACPVSEASALSTIDNLAASEDHLAPSLRPAHGGLTDGLHTPRNGAQARTGAAFTLAADQSDLIGTSTVKVSGSNGASHHSGVPVAEA